MKKITEKNLSFHPMDEIYSIRRMISEQYGPDVESISNGIRAERHQAEEEGFSFFEFPVVRHSDASISSTRTGNHIDTYPLSVAEPGAEYDPRPPAPTPAP